MKEYIGRGEKVERSERSYWPGKWMWRGVEEDIGRGRESGEEWRNIMEEKECGESVQGDDMERD